MTYTNRKIIAVFQPHRYSRLKFLKKDFALRKSFDGGPDLLSGVEEQPGEMENEQSKIIIRMDLNCFWNIFYLAL